MTEQKPLKIFPVGVKAGIPLMFHPRSVHTAEPVALETVLL
jgi:hypothetical protein